MTFYEPLFFPPLPEWTFQCFYVSGMQVSSIFGGEKKCGKQNKQELLQRSFQETVGGPRRARKATSEDNSAPFPGHILSTDGFGVLTATLSALYCKGLWLCLPFLQACEAPEGRACPAALCMLSTEHLEHNTPVMAFVGI